MTLPRPLVLPVPAPLGAGLAGLVARSARLNVLGDVKSTLAALDLPPTRPGAISLVVAGKEEALARRLGCETADIVAAATPYVGPQADRIVRWGDGQLFRPDLETRRRRVSPMSLAAQPHHRAAWMNLLIDWCPESLERLVDHCPRCRRRLGWSAAWGLGHCDDPHCDDLSAAGNRLPEGVADGYRAFCRLVSPVPGEREAMVASLAPDLAAVHPVALTDLTLKLGAAMLGIDFGGHDRFRARDPLDKARIAAEGATLLSGWPGGLRHAVRDEIGSAAGRTGAERRRLRAALIRAADAQRGGEAVKALIRAALPEVFVEVGKAFAGLDEKMVLGSPAALSLGVSHAELRAAAAAGVFHEEAVHEERHRRVQYRAREIDAAAVAWRGSTGIETVGRLVGVPRYACERIVACGDVEREEHPFVLRLPGQPRIVTSSFQAYVAEIEAACSTTEPPMDAVRLLAAMRVVGGRLKPWRQVLQAVRTGALPCWLEPGRGALVPRLRVRRAELARFAALGADLGLGSVAFLSDNMSQIDAVSVLNVGQIDGPRLIAAGSLSFRAGGRALLVGISDVLTLAVGYVATAEAAARLDMFPAAAYHLVHRALGAPVHPAGWVRSSFDTAFAGV